MDARVNPLSIVLIVALAAGFSSAIGCMNITSSGEYYLDSNVYGANISTTPLGGGFFACFKITSSDVVFDCNGFLIDSNLTSNQRYGILVIGPTNSTVLSNVTIRNCPRISRFGYPIYARNVTGLRVENATIFNTTTSGSYGIALINCSNGNISGNNISNIRTTGTGLQQAGIFLNTGSHNNIISNNVIFNINGTGSSSRYGIESNFVTPVAGNFNNTIYNNTIWNVNGAPVSGTNSSGMVIRNNTLFNSIGPGILLSNSVNTSISENIVYNITQDCSRFDICRNATIANNTIDICGARGILTLQMTYSNIVNNSVSNSSTGIEMSETNYTILRNNTLHGGTSYGIFMSGRSTNDQIINNTVQNYSSHGMYLAGQTSTVLFYRSIIANNTISNNSGHGIYMYNYVAQSNVLNNSIYGNGQDGVNAIMSNLINVTQCLIHSNAGRGVSLSGYSASDIGIINRTVLYNNSGQAIVFEGLQFANLRLVNAIIDSPAGGLADFANLSLNDSLSSFSSYSFNWTGTPPSPPFTVFGKFVNITRISGTITLNSLVWHWLDSELGSLDESKFDVFKYNSTGWVNLGATLNTSANTLTLTNHNPASDYGILEFTPASTTDCLLINASGTYTLSQNLSGAPISASELPGGYYFTCIKVAAPNVVLDCAGYHLIGNNSVNGTGIFLSPASSNVTVKNCNVHDYLYGSVGYGIIAYGSHGNLFMNNTVNGTGDGFYIGAGNNNTLANNTAYNNLGNGIRITESSNRSIVANNSAFGNNCNGFGIDGASANGTFTNNLASNNTCFAGFSIFASDNNTFLNNTACNNTRGPNLRGFQTMNADGNRFTNNTAFSVSEDAFAFYSATRSVLLNNTVANATRYGYYLSTTDDTNITNSTARNAQMGFFIDTGSRDWIIGSASYNSGNGFMASTCTDCRFINDYTFNQSSFAYFVTSGSLNTILANNTANRSNMGIFILSSTSTNLSNNTIFNSSSIGVFISDSTGVVMSGDRFSRNNPDLDVQGPAEVNATGIVFADPSGILQNFTNLSFSDILGSGEAYSINWSAQPSSLPPNHASFRNKYVNITRIAGSVNISRLAWSWLDSELNGSNNESNFALFKYNSSGWTNANNTPNVSGNILSLSNYAPGSAYAILEGTPSVPQTCPAPVTAPGSYNLSENATGAPNDASPFGSYWACVKIASSDVVFDCAGYNITNNGTANSIGIFLNGSLDNVTVKNCPNVSAYQYGAYIYNSNASLIRNTSISGSGWTGLYLENSYGNAVLDSTFSGNGDGLDMDESDFNRLDNLTFIGNEYGLGLYYGSDYNNFSNFAFTGLAGSDDQIGIGGNEGNILRNITIAAYDDTADDGTIYVWDNAADTFENLTITEAYASGIYLSPASNLTVRDSVINSSDYGLYADSGSSGNRLINTVISGSRIQGVYLYEGPGNSFENVTTSGTAGAGAYIYDSNTTFSGGRFFGNSPDMLLESAFSWPFQANLSGVVFTNPSGAFEDFTNLSINDSVDPDSSYSINWSAQPAGLPPDTESFENKHINITKVFGSPVIDQLVWHWQDAELNSSHDEERFALFSYSGAWGLVNGTPDTAANTLTNATLADFSVFSILQNVSDITPPQITLLSPPNGSTLNASSANLSFIAADDSAVAMNCSIYLDSALNQTNPSVLNGTSTAFAIAGIADGNHYWTVNCSDGINSNASIVWEFTVDTSVPADGGGDDDDEDRPLSISASSSCNGTTVSVTSRGNTVSNVEIRVDGGPAGTTNSSGQVSFEGCGKTVEIRASKPGYSTETVSYALISCDECRVEEPPEPPQNVTCPCGEVVNATCVPFECCSDSSCSSVEYCEIPSGKIGGDCVAVSGSCGEAKNHTFVPYGYQCGTEPGCPSCPADTRCEAHACISNDLTGPQTGFVGDNRTIEALENGVPCALCDLVVTDPLGKNLTGKTDASGRFTLPLSMKGAYTITLLRGGAAVKSMTLDALPKSPPAEPEKPAQTSPEEQFPWWLIILLLVIIAAFLYWRRREGEKAKPGTSAKTPKQ